MKWKRVGWQQRIGNKTLGGCIAEVWEGRRARMFVATAWRPYRGRNVFQGGRRYFKTEAAAKRSVEAYIAAARTPGKETT